MMRKVQIKVSPLIKTLHPTLHSISSVARAALEVMLVTMAGWFWQSNRRDREDLVEYATGETFRKSDLRSDLIYLAMSTLDESTYGLDGLGPQCIWQCFWFAMKWTCRGPVGMDQNNLYLCNKKLFGHFRSNSFGQQRCWQYFPSITF